MIVAFILGLLTSMFQWVVNLVLHWLGVILPFVVIIILVVVVINRLTRPPPVEHLIDYNNVSLPTGDGDYSRVSAFCKDGKLVGIPAFGTCYNLHHCLQRGFHSSNNGPCLGYRPTPKAPYVWISYGKVIERAANFGAGLSNLGVETNDEVRVGINSANRVEWIIAEHGAWGYSRAVVPLYDTLGPNACSYIIDHANIQTVVCDKVAKGLDIIKGIADNGIKGFKLLVVMDGPVTEELESAAAAVGGKVVLFADVEQLGVENPKPAVDPPSDALAFVMYTSGTTGNPKGAMITHGQFLCMINSVCKMIVDVIRPSSDDSIISYLPLAHGYEQGVSNALLAIGLKVGFFSGDIRNLTDDIMALQPTLFPAVPRVLNRIYDSVMKKASTGNPLMKIILDWAIKRKYREVRKGIARSTSFWDYVAFRPIQKGLGGKVRAIITGSAPLDSKVMQFMRCATGAYVLEGYGQTESSAVLSLQLPGEFEPGQVGGPLSCCKVKLVDVPEMDYYAKDGFGEICCKGGNVFKGYLNDPEKTAEAIDPDGWLHTGDIGTWAPNGSLKIIDRKKNIFKLAQGEYIAPEKIEAIYGRCPYINQIMVHGESLKSCLVSLIVPDERNLMKWALKQGLISEDGAGNKSATFEEVVAMERANKMILDDCVNLGKKAGLKSFEQHKDVCLLSDMWTMENNLLTPTQKVKRPALVKVFATEIAEMYKGLF